MVKSVKHFKRLLLLGLFCGQIQEQRPDHRYNTRSKTLMIRKKAGPNQKPLNDEEGPEDLRKLVQKGREQWTAHPFECLPCSFGKRRYCAFRWGSRLRRHSESGNHSLCMKKLFKNNEWKKLYTELQGRVYKGSR